LQTNTKYPTLSPEILGNAFLETEKEGLGFLVRVTHDIPE